MHYTIHMTANCNMRCTYCYVTQKPVKMTLETARAVVDNAIRGGQKRLGLIFFGGEPLLCRDLIEETIEYVKKTAPKDVNFHYKMTTNGLLLDEAFMEYANREKIYIALSLDGIAKAHDTHRIAQNGGSTHAEVERAAKLLLRTRPYAPALMTVNPDTVKYYAQSVEYLFELGFEYMICSLNYAVQWDKKALRELKRQYKRLAKFYYEHTLAEDKFYLSPFEVKISSHVHNKTYCHERCELGQRQLSVGPDGTLYPCVQFVGDERYSVGDVFNGIDEEKRRSLFVQNETEKPGCDVCSIRSRCNHYCACLNKQATGSIDKISPVLCAHERIILPIADKVAGKLYKKKNSMFIQKHYNDFYPVISLVEDKAGQGQSELNSN